MFGRFKNFLRNRGDRYQPSTRETPRSVQMRCDSILTIFHIQFHDELRMTNRVVRNGSHDGGNMALISEENAERTTAYASEISGNTGMKKVSFVPWVQYI